MNANQVQLDILHLIRKSDTMLDERRKAAKQLVFDDIKRTAGLDPCTKIKVGLDTGRIRVKRDGEYVTL